MVVSQEPSGTFALYGLLDTKKDDLGNVSRNPFSERWSTFAILFTKTSL